MVFELNVRDITPILLHITLPMMCVSISVCEMDHRRLRDLSKRGSEAHQKCGGMINACGPLEPCLITLRDVLAAVTT